MWHTKEFYLGESPRSSQKPMVCFYNVSPNKEPVSLEELPVLGPQTSLWLDVTGAHFRPEPTWLHEVRIMFSQASSLRSWLRVSQLSKD